MHRMVVDEAARVISTQQKHRLSATALYYEPLRLRHYPTLYYCNYEALKIYCIIVYGTNHSVKQFNLTT